MFSSRSSWRSDSCPLTIVWLSGSSDSVVVASLREVAIVLFEAIAPNTFLREVPPTTAVSSSAGALPRQTRICLVRIPRRPGHSNQSIVLLTRTLASPGRRIQDTSRVGPNGRDLELPCGSSDRTTGPQRGPFSLLSVLSSTPAPSPRLPYPWPGRRVGLCWEATRAPSQGPTPNGAARCRPLPFGIGTQALNPPGALPPRRPLAYSLPHSCCSLVFVPDSPRARHSA
jgi:hypothetical protein